MNDYPTSISQWRIYLTTASVLVSTKITYPNMDEICASSLHAEPTKLATVFFTFRLKLYNTFTIQIGFTNNQMNVLLISSNNQCVYFELSSLLVKYLCCAGDIVFLLCIYILIYLVTTQLNQI